MDTIQFLRDKGLLQEDKEIFKIIHDEAGELSLNELLTEYAEISTSEKEESYLRLAAEFENFRKRTQKEKQDLANNTKVKMLTSILDIDNDISIAIKSVKNQEAIDGLNLILKKVDTFLKSQGIEEIQTETYDSDLHEVISVINTGKDEIVDVISKGYTLNGNPFRYPKIVLSKKS